MDKLIENLALPKKESRALNLTRYKAMTAPGGYFDTLKNRELIMLAELRKEFPDKYRFYTEVAKRFANSYGPLMLQKYGEYISDEKKEYLRDLGKCVRIFKPGDAVELGLIEKFPDGRPKGDGGAFAKSELGLICFTPEEEQTQAWMQGLSEEQLTIYNALIMKGNMIHETFHLLINLKDEDEYFNYQTPSGVESYHGSAGVLLNEGVVEKMATSFAQENGLLHHPALSYLHYVDLANRIEQRVGNPGTFYRTIFNRNYNELLAISMNDQEILKYHYNERLQFLEKRYGTVFNQGINVLINSSKIEPSFKQ